MNQRIKLLLNYIFPALGGLFVTYLYNVVDGIFVGRGIGYAALGAVNIGVPFITSVVAVAAMFPMGGATVVAIRMGRKDKDDANAIAISRGIVIKALAVFLLPALFGIGTVWFAPLAAEVITLFIAVFLNKTAKLVNI